MKANEVRLTDFLSKTDTQFVIPIYQRNYDWKKNHCEQLINDILEAGRNEKIHFIGSIVYVHDGVYSSGIKELVVIDGQQRITTITLLCIALYHFLRGKNPTDMQANKIFKQFIVNEFAEENQRLKLKVSENNDSDLKALINDYHTDEETYSNIITNYKYFKHQISDENVDTILRGINMLIFVEVSLDRIQDNAQRIFESMNSTGLDLSQADLIRNYILMNLSAKEQNEIYKKYWEYIEISTRIGADNKMSEFIRDYLTLKTKCITKEEEVYKTFKQKYPHQDINKLEDVLSEIKQLAKPYSRLLSPTKEEDKKIQQEIKNINLLKINTSYPFLMKVYDDYLTDKIDKDCFYRILRFIQTFAIRRFVLDLPTNSFNKIFMVLYDKIDQSNYEESIYKYIMSLGGKQRIPNDSEIRETLKDKDIYSARGKNKEYLLAQLENWQNKEFVEIVGNDNITIEHIFPQTPNNDWKIQLNKEEYNDFASTYLHTLGNLTLSGNNGSLGNKTFEQKKYMNCDGKEQGYIYSRLWMNSYLKTIDSWNIKNYQERTKILIDRFLEVWKLPNIHIEKDSFAGEINIFDIDDPTGKTMQYARFFGKILRTTDSKLEYARLLIDVAKNIYEIAPKEFIENLSTELNLGKDLPNWRRPQKIDEEYSIETNLSAKDIFKRVRLILNTFRLEEDLYICFKDDDVI